MLTKEKEIDLLTTLVNGNGYFADTFKEDLQTMINNINSDFPMLYNTSVEKALEEERSKTKYQAQEYMKLIDDLKLQHDVSMQAAHKKHYLNLYEFYIEVLTKSPGEFDDYIANKMGLDEFIKFKRKAKLELNEYEIDYLISCL